MGTGMAAAAYPVPLFMHTQRARARMYADGSAIVQTATQEFGTGTATAMTQVAADGLGVRLGDMRCEVGDTDLPNASAGAAAAIANAVFHATGYRVRELPIAVEHLLAYTPPKSSTATT
jgi:xanthine dehydrogenase YagR molybdenum-binding subunit